MKTFQEQVAYVGANYLKGCTEDQHNQNLMAAILQCQAIKDEDKRKESLPELSALVFAKKMLLVDALRRRMGL